MKRKKKHTCQYTLLRIADFQFISYIFILHFGINLESSCDSVLFISLWYKSINTQNKTKSQQFWCTHGDDVTDLSTHIAVLNQQKTGCLLNTRIPIKRLYKNSIYVKCIQGNHSFKKRQENLCPEIYMFHHNLWQIMEYKLGLLLHKCSK